MKAVFICDICQSGTCTLSLNECGNDPVVCPFDSTYQADWVKQESPVIKQNLTTENEFCEWEPFVSFSEGFYNTSCDFTTDYIARFCQNCGKPIKIKE